MNGLNPKLLMLLFGCVMIGAMAAFLMLYEGSPGPLSSPHALAIGGTFIKSCKRCHTNQGLTRGCLDCHGEIARQIDQGKGYHTYLLQDKPTTCRQCHPEHHGDDFPLVSELSWQGQDPNEFNHPHVAFTLAGSHDKLACRECHNARLAKPFTLTAFPGMQRVSTSLGLSQDCLNCHTNIHASRRTRNCRQCHDQDKWKPARNFRHEEHFLLEGKHAQTACSACHLQDTAVSEDGTGQVQADRPPVFGPVKGKTCVDCHASPHRAVAGQDCRSCHYAADEQWSAGQRGVDSQLHAELGFVLEGAHAKQSCVSCHPSDIPYADRYPDPGRPGYARQAANCRGCHQTPHGDQFKERYAGCQDCHTQTLFKPSTLDTAWHAKHYPLTKAHANVACAKCHLMDKQTGIRRFTDTSTECRACHKDPHEDQFKDRYASCMECHHPDRFLPSTFGPGQHGKIYPLLGAHRAVACIQCHRIDPKTNVRQFKSTVKSCKACHADPHGTQFGQELAQGDCTVCHLSDSTTFQIRPYTHKRQTGFFLGEGHARAACQLCHIEQVDSPTAGRKIIRYRSAPTECAACHQDVHRGQFRQDGHTRCERCHDSTHRWTAHKFSHERDARFPLEGSHAKVACEACHPAVPQKTGQPVIQYRPLSTQCKDCHDFISK